MTRYVRPSRVTAGSLLWLEVLGYTKSDTQPVLVEGQVPMIAVRVVRVQKNDKATVHPIGGNGITLVVGMHRLREEAPL